MRTALIADLHDRGLQNDVSVIAWGEFGRSPTINKDGGRDHWPTGFSMLVAGGGFAGGRVIGATDPEGVKSLVKQFTPSRVVAAIRVSSEKVTMPDIECVLDVKETIDLARSLGMNRIMYADTSWEGTLQGPDLECLQEIASYSSMRITVGGGIGGPEQLWALQELKSIGIDSVVIGRALYENKFPCQGMWRSIEAKLEPDIS